MRINWLAPAALSIALLGTACSDRGAVVEEEAAEAPPVRVENASLGIALADLDDFAVAQNEDGVLELRPTAPETTGRITFEVGELQSSGVNLVEVVSAQRQRFEELPSGSFSGNRELMMADGRPAYYSRGQFDGDAPGERLEEIRISALHPSENRLLQVAYRFPAGEDSADRLNALLLVVSELEASGPAEAGPAEDDPSG